MKINFFLISVGQKIGEKRKSDEEIIIISDDDEDENGENVSNLDRKGQKVDVNDDNVDNDAKDDDNDAANENVEENSGDLPFSSDEETLIINYIVDNDYAAEVNGLAVWKLIW